MTPNMRAFIATYLFSALGLWSVLFHSAPIEFLIPHVLFYTVLTLNTYYSVRFYSAFTPVSVSQTIVDVLLVCAYAALALSIGYPVAFAYAAVVVFTVAPVKYVLLHSKTPHIATLRRKILIDLSGAALCVCVLGLTLLHMELSASWLLAALFAAANVYLLLIRPMYRHE